MSSTTSRRSAFVGRGKQVGREGEEKEKERVCSEYVYKGVGAMT